MQNLSHPPDNRPSGAWNPRLWLQHGLLRFRHDLASIDAIPQLALLGVMSGLVTALVILAFRAAIEIPLAYLLPDRTAEGFESLGLQGRLLLPVAGGLVLAATLHGVKEEHRRVGIAHVIERLSLHQGYISLKSWGLQFLCGVLTLTSGQSCGREGPAVHLGASSASLLGQWLNLPNNSIRTLVGCGTAAAISASFNTPIAGIIFAMEVVLLEYSLSGFTPVIIAAVTAAFITQTVHGDAAALTLPDLHLGSHWELPCIVVIALLIGVASASFVRLMSTVQRTVRLPLAWRLIGAGLLTGIVAVFVPQIMGVGYDTISAAIQQNQTLTFLLLAAAAKLVVTSVAIGLGVPGGLVGPSLFIGAAFGGAMGLVVAGLLPQHASGAGVYAVLGMGAMMAALLQAPLAAITAVIELTRSADIILPAMLMIVCSSSSAAHFFGQRSIFLTQLQLQGLDTRSAPLAVALRRVSVAALMDRSIVRAAQRLTIAEARKLLLEQPHWILVDGPDGPRSMLPAADLARYLDHLKLREPTEPSESAESGIDLITMPAQRRDLASLSVRATLEEALQRLQEKDVSALFIQTTSAPMIRPIVGIVTRESIETFYLVKG